MNASKIYVKFVEMIHSNLIQKSIYNFPNIKPGRWFYKMLSCCGFCLGDFHIHGVQAFFASFSVESYDISFADIVDKACSMYKNFLFRGVVDDESKSFGFVEKLYSSGTHEKKIMLLQRAALKGNPFFINY